MLDAFIYYVKFGGGVAYVFWSLLLLSSYSYVRALLLGARYFSGDATALRDLKILGRGTFLICVLFFLWALFLGVGLKVVGSHPGQDQVVFFNNLFITIDNAIFGVYVPFWFQDKTNALKPFFDMLTPLLLFFYRNLVLCFGMIFFLSLVIGVRHFCKFSLAFVFSLLFALPFWYFFPATSPYEGFLKNTMKVSSYSPGITHMLSNYSPNASLTSFLNRTPVSQNEEGHRFFAITSMPSMHVAWAIIILYFGFNISRSIGLLLIPWFFFNILATLFTLQHYTIDVIGGVLVSVFSIFLASFFSSRYVPRDLDDFSLLLRRDYEYLQQYLFNFLKIVFKTRYKR